MGKGRSGERYAITVFFDMAKPHNATFVNRLQNPAKLVRFETSSCGGAPENVSKPFIDVLKPHSAITVQTREGAMFQAMDESESRTLATWTVSSSETSFFLGDDS